MLVFTVAIPSVGDSPAMPVSPGAVNDRCGPAPVRICRFIGDGGACAIARVMGLIPVSIVIRKCWTESSTISSHDESI